MKSLRRFSLSFRRPTRQQQEVHSDGDVEHSSHTSPRPVFSGGEALSRRPRRRLTKKKHAQRPSLDVRVQDEQHARVPPSPSPSPPPPLARVPFPPQKRVPPPAFPDLSPSSSRSPESTPTKQVLGFHDNSFTLLTPTIPPPTPLSVIVEQDELSLRSAGFSFHSAAGPPAAGDLREHEQEREHTSGERRRTGSGLSSLKDASRPGSASDKARSIYERPPAPAPPSPPATPTREPQGQTLPDERKWASEATAVTPHLLDDAPVEKTVEEESGLNILPHSNHAPFSTHDQEQDDKPTSDPFASFESTTSPAQHMTQTTVQPTTSLPTRLITSLPSQSTTSLPSQFTSFTSQPHTSHSARPTSLPPHLQPHLPQHQPTFQIDGRMSTTHVYTPHTPFAPNPNHTSSPNSSTALFPHSPTDTDAYVTAAESLMDDADSGYATPVGEHPTSDGHEVHERSVTPVMQYDHDTPTATVRARDRPRVMVGTGGGGGVGDIYQYPPARHTFGLWDAEGSQEINGGVDSEGSEDELREESGSGSRSGDQDGAGEEEEEEISPADVDNIDDPSRVHTRHGSNSTMSPATAILASPLISIPNPASAWPLNVDLVHSPPARPPHSHSPPASVVPVVPAPVSAFALVPGSDSVVFSSVTQTPVTLSEPAPEMVPLPHISESASLPHLSDSVHSLPLPLPPSLTSRPPSSQAPPALSQSLSSYSEPEPEPASVHPPPQRVQVQPQPQPQGLRVSQEPEARTALPPAPAPQILQSPSSPARHSHPRALRPHPFLEGHAGEKLGGRGGGLWDVRISGGEAEEGDGDGNRVGEEDRDIDRDVEEEEERRNKGEGEDEPDEEISVQRPVGSKVGDTFAEDHIGFRRGSAADRRFAPFPGQAHLGESSTPFHPAQSHSHPHSSSQPPREGLHNRPLPAVPAYPPGLPTTTPSKPRTHLTSDASASSLATTATIVSPMTFSRRPSLVSTPTPNPASSSHPPSPPSFPPPSPRLISASPPTGTSPATFPQSSTPPPSSPPLSRSRSLTGLIASTLTRPARTMLKKRGRTVSTDSGRDGGSNGGRGIEPSFNMVAPGMTGEAYGVEAWHRNNGGESRTGPHHGAQMARVLVQPPSPSPSSLEGPSHQPQPPPRQQYYSWAGQEEFTASLVAEYGAMLSPFLATPGNSRPQSYDDHGGGPPGNMSLELAQSGSGEQTLSLRSAELERAALLAAKPPKRVGRKLSKRRKPLPVPVIR